MEWDLNPFRYWSVTPINFVPLLHQLILKESHHCRSRGMYLGWCLLFSFDSVQSTIQYHGHQSIWAKALGRHQLNFSLFNELRRYYLQQQKLIITLWRAVNSLGSTLGCLGVSMRSYCPTTQLDVTHSQNQRWLHLTMRDVQLGLRLSHYLEIPPSSPSYMYIYFGTLYQVSIQLLKFSLVLSDPLHTPYFTPTPTGSSCFNHHPCPTHP